MTVLEPKPAPEEQPDDLLSALDASDAPENGVVSAPPPLAVDPEQDADEAESAQQRRFSLPRIYWQREHIRGYQVGDLRSEKPVLIHPDATLLGNVIAPRLTVAGQLSGSAIAEEVQVAGTGKIWGDLYAVRLKIETGGQVQGWISSVTPAVYTQLRETAVFPPALPEEDAAGEEQRDPVQAAALHQLQEETAVAHAARAELEHDFERRLSEVAKGASGKISSLTEQLSQLRETVAAQDAQIDQANTEIRQQGEQLARQTEELNSAHNLLGRQTKELADLQTAHDALQTMHDALQAEKEGLDEALTLRNQELEKMQSRVQALEIAHRNSIQHSVDQEEALIRWQELAETTEQQVQSLTAQLEAAQEAIAEQEAAQALLKRQKTAAEEKLAAFFAGTADAQETRAFVDEITGFAAAADEEYARAEELIWLKATLEATQAEFDALQEQFTTLQAEMDGRTQSLQEKEARIRELEQDLTAKTEALAQQEAETAVSPDHTVEITNYQDQITALESQIAQLTNNAAAQAAQIEQLQADLAYKEVRLGKATKRLDKAKVLLDKQSQFIQELQSVTGDKIRTLQSELKTTRQR